MKIQYPLALMLLTVIVTGSALAGPLLIGGKIADPDPASGVFNLYVKDDSENARSMFCTATKVAPDLILTAAHCVYRRKVTRVGFSNAVTTNPVALAGLEVTKVLIHPSYFEDENFLRALSGNDVALVRVRTTADFEVLRTVPVSFDAVAPGNSVQIWGYGCHRSALDRDPEMVKKVGTSETLNLDSMRDIGGNYPGALRPWARGIFRVKIVTGGQRMDGELPSLCDGDSGGPVIQNGSLVGVNSSGIFNDVTAEGEVGSGVFYLNLHNRLANLSGWLKRYLY